MAAVSRRPDGLTATIAALALLLGGMPLTLGVIIHRSEAMFTLVRDLGDVSVSRTSIVYFCLSSLIFPLRRRLYKGCDGLHLSARRA
jgi:hypothetical protein